MNRNDAVAVVLRVILGLTFSFVDYPSFKVE